jgi:8-oxo-dGTP diphosphatase
MINCTFEDGAAVSLRHATVDTLVIKDGRILLVKRNKRLIEGGKWGLTGGYMDRDENMTQAAVREVLEESGWTIKNLQLLTIRSNPDRPHEDRQNISLVFFAEAVAKTGEPDWESDDVQWFDLNNLPPRKQIAFDHADNIDLYQRYLKERLALPVC